jgi:hypothetical protein
MINRDVASLVGASVLSAAGSLPLHLTPLIIPVLVVDGRASVADAGWIATAVLLGQFATALALPLFDVRLISRAHAIGLTLALMLGLGVSAVAGMTGLLLGWFLVGLCCGGFQYLGTITAATHSRPAFAFPIRLGVVLCLAGAAAASFQWSSGLQSYESMLTLIALIFASVLAVGITFHRPTKPPSRTLDRDTSAGREKYVALAVVLIVFVGQSGVLAYAVQGATERGIVLQEASWALAIMKVVAGLCLLVIARRGLQNRQNPRFMEIGVALAISDLVIATTSEPVVFFVALLSLEVCFNILSARLQAKVSDVAPYFAGQWLVATMLFGAAAGPGVHGLAIRVDFGGSFVAFAVLSAVIPAVVLWMAQKGARASA